MNKNTLFELTLFDPANTLINLIEKQKIEYTKIPKTQKFVMATDETIKFLIKRITVPSVYYYVYKH